MDLGGYLQYRRRLLMLKPKRYRNLLHTIFDHRCRRLLEVGVWNGVHARQMIETAAVRCPIDEVRYAGFDLFEDLTGEALVKEFSKRPPSLAEVWARLEATGAHVRLYKGDSKVTIPQALGEIGPVDFVFIDGGHSVETVTSDWRNIERILAEGTVVIFDDYYPDDHPRLARLGCRDLVESLRPDAYHVEVLSPEDRVRQAWGEHHIQMVRVMRKPTPRP